MLRLPQTVVPWRESSYRMVGWQADQQVDESREAMVHETRLVVHDDVASADPTPAGVSSHDSILRRACCSGTEVLSWRWETAYLVRHLSPEEAREGIPWAGSGSPWGRIQIQAGSLH